MRRGATGDDAFVLPGQAWFGAAPGQVATLLGSCVSMVCWHPTRRLGGLCHFVLPRRPRGGPPGAADGRYGEEAIMLMYQHVRRHGTDPGEYHAWLFGGATQTEDGDGPGVMAEIGRRNVECARRECAATGFALRAEDVGGGTYRRLRLDLSTGTVDVARGPMAHAQPVFATARG